MKELQTLLPQPNAFFLAAGASEGWTALNAFDGALLAAGIGDVNLVKMSSILPPACKPIQPFQLPYGALVPVAYAAYTSAEPGERIAAAVAVAIPEDEQLPGLIMEYEGRGTKQDIEEHVREMAKRGMETRHRAIKSIESISVEHKVEKIAGIIAAVVLWTI
ncbi:MAG: arginine decarboxylase, pyruvoyl-dependent [bacterium]|nr:arginine decarboxylase, pyruvoyl-dependent [bacterium]